MTSLELLPPVEDVAPRLVDPAATPDATLSGYHANDIAQQTWVTVAAGGLEIGLMFDSAGPEKIVELLPQARRILAAIDRIGVEGAEFLWTGGVGGKEPAGDADKSRFLAAMQPNELVIARSGDFELHFSDDGGGYFLDGYWPAVWFRADLTPAAFYIAA